MIEALAAISGTGLLGALAAVVYLAIKLVSANESLADARVAQSVTEEHLAESAFKLEQVQLALTASEHVVDVQSKELSADDEKPINTDLAADDTATRVRRLFASWAVSDASARAAAVASSVVPAPPPAAAPNSVAR